LPFEQIIGVTDKTVLETYFSRYLLAFIIFQVTSVTFVFPGFSGEGFPFLLLLSILHLCPKRISFGRFWSCLWIWCSNSLRK